MQSKFNTDSYLVRRTAIQTMHCRIWPSPLPPVTGGAVHTVIARDLTAAAGSDAPCWRKWFLNLSICCSIARPTHQHTSIHSGLTQKTSSIGIFPPCGYINKSNVQRKSLPLLERRILLLTVHSRLCWVGIEKHYSNDFQFLPFFSLTRGKKWGSEILFQFLCLAAQFLRLAVFVPTLLSRVKGL